MRASILNHFSHSMLALVLASSSVTAQGQKDWEQARLERIEVITGEWSPYVSAFDSWGDAPRSDAFGLATELLNSALQQCGAYPRFLFRQWDDVLRLAESKNAMAFPFRYTQERAKRFTFSEPVIFSQEYLFFNPKTAPYLAKARSLADIKDAKLVFVKGYEYAEAYEAYRNDKSLEVDSEKLAFQQVIDAQADAIFSDKNVGNFILKTHFPDKGRLIEVNSEISNIAPLSVLIPKALQDKQRVLLDCLNDQFAYTSDHDGQKLIALRMQLDKDYQYHVLLDGPSDSPVAIGTEEVDSTDGYLIPRGSTALVLDWDDAFEKKQDVGNRQLVYRKTQVKLLSGPLKGRVLWVPNIFLRQ